MAESWDGTAKINADWTQNRHWSEWIAAHDSSFSEAILCTQDKIYTASVTYVPGATADDAPGHHHGRRRLIRHR
ncbi:MULTISPECIES: hypothetical protein [Arthrobacter]|nr:MULTISPECIES: hypothetical protein [Arthrobacter]